MGLRILTIVLVLKEKSLASNILLVYTSDFFVSDCSTVRERQMRSNARKIEKKTIRIALQTIKRTKFKFEHHRFRA